MIYNVDYAFPKRVWSNFFFLIEAFDKSQRINNEKCLWDLFCFCFSKCSQEIEGKEKRDA